MIFVCSYHHDTSGYDRRKNGTKFRKLKEEFKGKSLNMKDDIRLKRDKYAARLTENLQNIDQWRNSYELYRARARGTQTIGLSGGHPDLSCPGDFPDLFIQFPVRMKKDYENAVSDNLETPNFFFFLIDANHGGHPIFKSQGHPIP